MKCMKCGREIDEGQVFCPDCLLVMAKYPVKPGTAIVLPKKRDSAVKRPAPRRKLVTPEDQIRKLRRSLRTVFIMWLITFLLLCVMVYPIMREERVSSSAAWREMESVMGKFSFASFSMRSTNPQVESEICRYPIFRPSGEPTSWRNLMTLS